MSEQMGGFRSGTDALLLAAYAMRHKSDMQSFVELGCGDGLAMQVLSKALHETNAASIMALGIDKQAQALTRAQNQPLLLGVKKSFLCADVTQKKAFRALYTQAKSQSGIGESACVLANPPYYKNGGGRVSQDTAKSMALHQSAQEDILQHFCAAARFILGHHGWFFSIYAAERFLELTKALEQQGFGLRSLMPVHTRPEKSARWILICARKGAKHDVCIEPSICLYARKKSDRISNEAKAFCPWL